MPENDRSTPGQSKPWRREQVGTRQTSLARYVFATHKRIRGEALAATLLTLMALSLVGLSIFHHRRIDTEFNRGIGQALGTKAALGQLHTDIARQNYAERVESSLATMASNLAAIIAVSTACDSSALCAESPGVIVVQDRPLREPIQARSETPRLLWRQFEYERSSADLSNGERLDIWLPKASEESPTNPLASRIGQLFAQAYDSFPALEAKEDSPAASNGESVARWIAALARRLGLLTQERQRQAEFIQCALAPGMSLRTPDQLADEAKYGKSRERALPRPAAPGEAVVRDTTKVTEPSNLVYACYPEAPLPDNYHPEQRPWYSEALESKNPIWSTVYGDPGTGEPVITVSQRVIGAGGDVVAVIAVDLHVETLQSIIHAGPPKFANFYLTLAASFTLLGILYASGRWIRFQFIFMAIASFTPLYYSQSLFYLFAPNTLQWRRAGISVDIFLSLLNSALIVLAAFLMYNEVQRRYGRSYRFFKTVSNWIENVPATSAFFVFSGSSLLVWVVTLALSNAFGGERLDQQELMNAYWVDAIVAFAATVYFGSRLAIWGRNFLRNRNFATTLIIGIYVPYAALQLGYPVLQDSGGFIWLLFWGKIATLSAVICVVFSNTQNYNYVRRQIGALIKKIFSRSTGHSRFVLIGKITQTYWPILAMSSVAQKALGYEPRTAPVDLTDSDPERIKALQKMVEESIFGSGEMYEPLLPRDIREHFEPSLLQRLDERLETDWRTGGVKREADIEVVLHTLQDEAVHVTLEDIVAWRDSRVGHPQGSEKFIVLVGQVTRHEARWEETPFDTSFDRA